MPMSCYEVRNNVNTGSTKDNNVQATTRQERKDEANPAIEATTTPRTINWDEKCMLSLSLTIWYFGLYFNCFWWVGHHNRSHKLDECVENVWWIGISWEKGNGFNIFRYLVWNVIYDHNFVLMKENKSNGQQSKILNGLPNQNKKQETIINTKFVFI